jgi:hypothetical protein
MLVFSADDKNIPSVVSDIGWDGNAGEIILKSDFKQWLKTHCVGYKYVGIENMIPYIYFENKNDALSYKLSFDKIYEVVIITIDDTIINNARKVLKEKGETDGFQD